MPPAEQTPAPDPPDPARWNGSDPGPARPSQQAVDAVMVAIAVILASGAVYAIARQLILPEWYPVLLGTIVSFAYGRASAR